MSASEANRQRVRNAYDSLLSGDLTGFLTHFDDDSILIEPASLSFGGTVKGVAHIQQVYGRIFDAWSEVSVKIERLLSDDETVISYCQVSGTAKATGRPITFPLIELWELRPNGKVARLQPFFFDTHSLKSALERSP